MIEKRDIERLVKVLEDLKELTCQVARVAYALESRGYSPDPLCRRQDACKSCGCTLIPFGATHCPCCRTAVSSGEDDDGST